MGGFTYDLKEALRIKVSGEEGEVIAQAHFLDGEDNYRLRYKCADGRAVENWWGESALERATDDDIPY